ncbi:kinase-like domain-containing protein [Mycena floridula]|nr:kinase-like domain-containing protein [Mycena floridula]
MGRFPSEAELCRVIDEFVADAGVRHGLDGDRVRAIIDEYLFERSTNTTEFICQISSHLKMYPSLVRKIDIILQACGVKQRVEVITSDDDVIAELIVVGSHAGAQIHALWPDIVPPAGFEITNAQALRAIVRLGSLDSILTNTNPKGTWLRALAELLQYEIKHSSEDAAYRVLCLHHLKRLVHHDRIIPPSFFVHDAVPDGRGPVLGGGFADIWMGKLRGKPVCLKVLRFYENPEDLGYRLFNKCRREALLWKQLDHPNILPFLGLNTEIFPPTVCLVSPWMANGNLRQYSALHPEFDRLTAIRQIAAGIQYLHEHEPPIVHADIRGVRRFSMSC